MNKTEKTCCFTGHRYISDNERPYLYERLKTEIISLIDKGIIYFGTGGALGFDTLAATAILELKGLYTQIRLILVLPCKNQTLHWKNEDIELYNTIIEYADKVVYTSDNYDDNCMLKRNRHLVDNSKYCIAYLKKNSGGSAYTVDYAKEHGKTVINLAEF